jgi:hypothetical protein
MHKVFLIKPYKGYVFSISKKVIKGQIKNNNDLYLHLNDMCYFYTTGEINMKCAKIIEVSSLKSNFLTIKYTWKFKEKLNLFKLFKFLFNTQWCNVLWTQDLNKLIK